MICFQCYDEGKPAWKLPWTWWIIHRILHSCGLDTLFWLHRKGILKDFHEGQELYFWWEKEKPS